MKLIAITSVKYDGKDKDGKPKQLEAAPGQEFSVDDETAKALIEAGGAATPEDYERAKAAAKTPDERMAELEAENAALRTELAAKSETETKKK